MFQTTNQIWISPGNIWPKGNLFWEIIIHQWITSARKILYKWRLSFGKIVNKWWIFHCQVWKNQRHWSYLQKKWPCLLAKIAFFWTAFHCDTSTPQVALVPEKEGKASKSHGLELHFPFSTGHKWEVYRGIPYFQTQPSPVELSIMFLLQKGFDLAWVSRGHGHPSMKWIPCTLW